MSTFHGVLKILMTHLFTGLTRGPWQSLNPVVCFHRPCPRKPNAWWWRRQPVDGRWCHAVHQRYWSFACSPCWAFQKTCRFIDTSQLRHVFYIPLLHKDSWMSTSLYLFPLCCRRLTAKPCCCCVVTRWWNTWAWSSALRSNSLSTLTGSNRLDEIFLLSSQIIELSIAVTSSHPAIYDVSSSSQGDLFCVAQSSRTCSRSVCISLYLMTIFTVKAYFWSVFLCYTCVNQHISYFLWMDLCIFVMFLSCLCGLS